MLKKTLIAVSVVAAATLAVAGCGTSNSTSNSTASKTTHKAASSSTKKATASKASQVTMAKVTLKSAKGSNVKGTTNLKLNKKTHELTVSVTTSGLKPKNVYPESIYSGTASKIGASVYSLTSLTANKNGDASSITVIKNVKKIPQSGWMIGVKQSSKSSTVLASGDVTTK